MILDISYKFISSRTVLLNFRPLKYNNFFFSSFFHFHEYFRYFNGDIPFRQKKIEQNRLQSCVEWGKSDQFFSFFSSIPYPTTHHEIERFSTLTNYHTSISLSLSLSFSLEFIKNTNYSTN